MIAAQLNKAVKKKKGGREIPEAGGGNGGGDINGPRVHFGVMECSGTK